jgi:hypothetical protein
MSDAGPSVARFDFANGALRGTHLMLYANCLVHRGDAQLETLPLATIASVRVAFERDPRAMRWGIALLIVALVVLLMSAPLATFSGNAAGELAAAGGQGVARALQALFRLLELLATLLPVLALATAIGGAALAGFGWLGNTRLSVIFAGYERDYSARGRNPQLLDFSEALAGQLMSSRR